jgi:hypothetical protein
VIVQQHVFPIIFIMKSSKKKVLKKVIQSWGLITGGKHNSALVSK